MIAIICWSIVFGCSILVKFSVMYGTPTSPWYFLIGYVLANKCGLALEVGKGKRGWNLVFLCGSIVAFVAIKTLVILCPACARNGLLRMVSVVAQIGFIWFGYDALFSRVKMCFPRCLDVVFFVYCFHGILLAWLSPILCEVCAVVSYGIIVVASFIIANVMQMLCGNCYRILTGGR